MTRNVTAIAMEPRIFYQNDRTVAYLPSVCNLSYRPMQFVNCGAALRSVSEIALSDVVMASNPGQKLLSSRDFLRYLVSPKRILMQLFAFSVKIYSQQAYKETGSLLCCHI